MTELAKSDIRHPIAKRSMVVFAIVLLAAAVVEAVHRTDVGDALFAIALVGFLASVLIAREKKSNVPDQGSTKSAAFIASEKKSTVAKIPWKTGVKAASTIEDIKTPADDFFGLVGIILSGILFIALAIAFLWGIVVVVKWMWTHS